MSSVTSVSRWTQPGFADRAFIAGNWHPAAGDTSVAVINPATESSLGSARYASKSQIDAAIAAAYAARTGPWAEVGPLERSTLLTALCDEFAARRAEFIECVVDEVGTSVASADGLQVDSALATLRWFAEAALRGPATGYETGLPLSDDPFMSSSVIRQEPVGVVASITAYNYPLLLLARKLGGVLASGCTTVVLPSDKAPLSTLLFFEILDQIGYPAGVTNLVIGGPEAGKLLSTDSRVDMVSFTGSVKVGASIMRQASDTVKKVVLELGGKSPTIILPGADLEAVVPPSTLRYMAATGQGCGCTTRILVPRDMMDDYVAAVEAFMESAEVGDPTVQSTVMGPLISGEHRASVEGYIERAIQDGGRVLAGGGRPSVSTGFFMNPVLIGGVSNEAEIARNELFGPVAVLFPYDSIDEAIAIANDTPFGLNAGVFGPIAEAMKVARRLRSGSVSINGGGGFRADVPWGGPGHSGVGREGGEAGFAEFFEAKHIQWRV